MSGDEKKVKGRWCFVIHELTFSPEPKALSPKSEKHKIDYGFKTTDC